MVQMCLFLVPFFEFAFAIENCKTQEDASMLQHVNTDNVALADGLAGSRSLDLKSVVPSDELHVSQATVWKTTGWVKVVSGVAAGFGVNHLPDSKQWGEEESTYGGLHMTKFVDKGVPLKVMICLDGNGTCTPEFATFGGASWVQGSNAMNGDGWNDKALQLEDGYFLVMPTDGWGLCLKQIDTHESEVIEVYTCRGEGLGLTTSAHNANPKKAYWKTSVTSSRDEQDSETTVSLYFQYPFTLSSN